MTKILQQIIEEQVEEFDKQFCEKDRGLRTRMKARNSISMADGIKDFLRTFGFSIARQIAESLRVEKNNKWHESNKDFGYYQKGYNDSLIEIESKEKEFFGELS